MEFIILNILQRCHMYIFSDQKFKLNVWNDDNLVLVSALMKTGNSHYQQTKVNE